MSMTGKDAAVICGKKYFSAGDDASSSVAATEAGLNVDNEKPEAVAVQ